MWRVLRGWNTDSWHSEFVWIHIPTSFHRCRIFLELSKQSPWSSGSPRTATLLRTEAASTAILINESSSNLKLVQVNRASRMPIAGEELNMIVTYQVSFCPVTTSYEMTITRAQLLQGKTWNKNTFHWAHRPVPSPSQMPGRHNTDLWKSRTFS